MTVTKSNRAGVRDIRRLLRRATIVVIHVARKLLYHTRIGNFRITSRAYAFLFNLSAPDLTQPITFRGTALFVDPADRSYVPGMVAGFYEKRELDIFEQLAKEASVFFDVGANIGVYSVIGCLASRDLVSYAFEPIDENQELLARNIAAHQLESRVLVQPLAVSDKQGKTSIHLGQSGNHSIDNDQGKGRREIETIRLDDFSMRSKLAPDIIKIDVEGHEGAVIDGAVDMLSRHAPTVFMEYIPTAHKDVNDLIDRLEALFETCYVVDDVSYDVTEIELGKLNRRKSYNLILTANSRHIETIRRFVTA
jgi:FkbM family methyltransferase